MRGIRFINRICKEFDLKITESFEGYSDVFHKSNYQNKITYFELNNIFTFWISKQKIALLIRSTATIHYFPIQEKYKILQLISEALSE